MKWIDDHVGLILIGFVLIGVIEIGIGAWRLPKELRSGIIPKADRLIQGCDELKSRTDELEIIVFEILIPHKHRYHDGKMLPQIDEVERTRPNPYDNTL